MFSLDDRQLKLAAKKRTEMVLWVMHRLIMLLQGTLVP